MKILTQRTFAAIILVLLITSFYSALSAEKGSLNALIENEDTWSCSVSQFPADYPGMGFSFVDAGVMAKSNHTNLVFMGFRVWEARFNFKEKNLSSIELSVYNKGDAGELEQGDFKNKIEQLCEKLQVLTASRGITGKVSNERANYFVNRRSWKYRETSIQAEWAFVRAHRSGGTAQPFRAEFIKVILTPLRSGSISGKSVGRPDWARHVSGRIIKENVEQNSTGDIWVSNVPMVDQGQKGYCAAASAERVLRYYGWQGDQHEIAQLADTAAQGGTSLEGMIAAVAVVGKRYQLTDKTLVDPGGSRGFEKSEFFNMIKQYNRTAKSTEFEAIDYMNFADIQPNNVRMINTMSIFEAMDAEVLKRARLAQRQDFNRFQQNILNYVQQGVPLFWACIVGKYPENPDLGKNGAFGHVRLIIGINTKENEILYSDSWGPQHALKRMTLENAWAMTFGLTVLKPQDVR